MNGNDIFGYTRLHNSINYAYCSAKQRYNTNGTIKIRSCALLAYQDIIYFNIYFVMIIIIRANGKCTFNQVSWTKYTA